MGAGFDCPDCGYRVFNVVDSIPSQRCLTCQWIADARPEDRERLRSFLFPPEPAPREAA